MPPEAGHQSEFRGLVERLKQAIFLREADDAARLFGVVLAKDPNFLLRGSAQYDLARLLEQGAHDALAFEAFRMLVDHQPDNKARNPALRSAGVLAYRLRRFVPAAKYLREFLQTDPTHVEREEAERILERINAAAQKRREVEEEVVNTPPDQSHLAWEEISTPKVEEDGDSKRRKVVYEDWHIPTENLLQESPKAAKARKPDPKSEFMPKKKREQIEAESPSEPPPSAARMLRNTPPPEVIDFPSSPVGWQPAVGTVPPPPSAPEKNPYAPPPPPVRPPKKRDPGYLVSQPPDQTPEPPYISLDLPPAETPQTHLGPIRPMPRTAQPPAWPSMPAVAPPSGFYPTPSAPPPPQPPPPAAQAAYGIPTPMPLPGMGMPTPVPITAAPAPPAAPPAEKPVPAPPHREDPAARYERLRNRRFALLLPHGKRIHLEEVTALVARNERLDEREAQKQVLRRKGLIYGALTMDEMLELHPKLVKMRQHFLFVDAAPELQPAAPHAIVSASLHEKGLKMTTRVHYLKIRWEDIRLLNCGYVGRDGLISILGGNPMQEYRFVAGTFDFENFLCESHRDFAVTVRRFLEQITEKSVDALRSATVQHLLQGKTRQPQTFASEEEYHSYTLWMIYNQYAEKVDAHELAEIGKVASRW